MLKGATDRPKSTGRDTNGTEGFPAKLSTTDVANGAMASVWFKSASVNRKDEVEILPLGQGQPKFGKPGDDRLRQQGFVITHDPVVTEQVIYRNLRPHQHGMPPAYDQRQGFAGNDLRLKLGFAGAEAGKGKVQPPIAQEIAKVDRRRHRDLGAKVRQGALDRNQHRQHQA